MQQTTELLRLLQKEEVEFVVIGGVAAVAYGASYMTEDLDIVAPFSTDNVQRLLNAVAAINPRHAMRPELRIVEPAEKLARWRNIYIRTDIGRVDVLCDVPPLGTFEAIEPGSKSIELGGQRLKLIALKDLLTVKEHVARPKDLIVAAQLRKILERTAGGG